MAPPVEIKPLRKCRVCGLEAWTELDLEAFSKDKTAPFDRNMICKKCKCKEVIYRRDHPKPKIILPYLRKCVMCGLEAHTKEELVLFIDRKRHLYNKANWCKKCTSKHTIEYMKERPLMVRYSIIKQRCYDPNSIDHKYYYDRGITICDEWLDNSQTFYNWANSHGFKPELEIDRIDNNKGYSPENCRWVTQLQQARNKRKKTTIPSP